jgi:peptidyl-prolyl cis-trans isomerase SurA
MKFWMMLMGVFFFAGLSQSQATELIDGTYVTVNEEMITHSDIEKYQKQLRSRLLYDDLIFPDDAAIEESLKDKTKLVDRMIGEKLMDSEAKKLGINITDDAVNKEIQGKGGESHLSSLLASKGLTLRDYRNFLRKNLARKEVVRFHVSSKIKLSDEDIMDYYMSNNKGSVSGQSFEYNLSHILFASKNPEQKKMSQERAQEALKALQGQSFTVVQRKFNPSENDDAFGVFKSGEMLPSIEAAVTNLRSGETSTIVETPMGFHIFKLNSRKVVNNPDFERRKQQIFQMLFVKSYKEQLEYWLNQKRKISVVKFNEKK